MKKVYLPMFPHKRTQTPQMNTTTKLKHHKQTLQPNSNTATKLKHYNLILQPNTNTTTKHNNQTLKPNTTKHKEHHNQTQTFVCSSVARTFRLSFSSQSVCPFQQRRCNQVSSTTSFPSQRSPTTATTVAKGFFNYWMVIHRHKKQKGTDTTPTSIVMLTKPFIPLGKPIPNIRANSRKSMMQSNRQGHYSVNPMG